MSNSKKSFVDTEMTRRQFLKISGKSLAGVAITTSMLSLFGCSQKEVDEGNVSTWAMPQGLLIVNAAKCTGCQRCEINCTLTNDGECSTYISRIKVGRNLHINGEYGMLNDSFVYYPDTCRQCEDPACGNACPQHAITTNEAGARVVNQELCIGCGACTQACPWHLPTVNPETKKSSKCVACGACIAGCPSGALSLVSWEALADVVSNKE